MQNMLTGYNFFYTHCGEFRFALPHRKKVYAVITRLNREGMLDSREIECWWQEHDGFFGSTGDISYEHRTYNKNIINKAKEIIKQYNDNLEFGIEGDVLVAGYNYMLGEPIWGVKKVIQDENT